MHVLVKGLIDMRDAANFEVALNLWDVFLTFVEFVS